ncbi:small integral membrane protein 20 isoform X2 [Alexandromys fortis]|uniref:small integral membrane protein 20 isoform X2 n=1 Tax=Alexandromys fortis TaxID=100897 RepID=UPI002153A670|nr:small integral membrane protein 20 isoform X2 [Microtus fortis]
MAVARNLRTALIFGGFISMVGAAFYPIYFRPLMRLEEYRVRRKDVSLVRPAGFQLSLCSPVTSDKWPHVRPLMFGL